MFDRGRPLITALMVLFLITWLAACGNGDDPPVSSSSSMSATSTSSSAEGDVGLAPEFASIDGWYNSDPLTLAELRGSPVLLVFWSDT